LKKRKDELPAVQCAVAERDTILAVLQSDIGIAGLILVFVGFLLTKGETYETRRGDKYRVIALLSLLPVLACVVSIWICMDAIEGSAWCAAHSLSSLKLVLVMAGIYAIIATVWSAT
jgi:uncharacterized membrane protein